LGGLESLFGLAMAVKFLKSAHQIATQELGPGLSSALGVRRCYRRGLRRIAEEAASPSAKQSKAKQSKAKHGTARHSAAQGVPDCESESTAER
jgi:hypothetical protein